ncbi:hypothetical protein PFICI_13677 [Pestalotiopsis fici W106-1]|uniref:SprT-like domain-containing protein n=1 Tax=Pestalotiopsis fici (strain W106-1 / CGMCC3.15140) TaxID=1229662 RepID=W3WMV7_PESFW|nr:uncharacterized protein PFICI_13677 [Pestalotiopsis fici W106-1]ETS75193.1 hypothetical protein PFICI_13677 [Pestalotiopsis fici W106-1]
MERSDWNSGGMPLSRSYSASSSFLDTRFSNNKPRLYPEGGKRPHPYVFFEVANDNGYAAPQYKRPRFCNAAPEAHNQAQVHAPREPAFFILREAGREAGQPSPSPVPCYDYDTSGSASRVPSPATSDRFLESEVQPHRFVRPDLRPPLLERTSSGLSIAPEDEDSNTQSNYSDMKKDQQAGHRVERHFAHYHKPGRDSKAERILKSLISPRSSPGKEFEIDDAALNNIFRATNEIFFFGCLRNRVRWDWSDVSNKQYHTQIIGTTALRTAQDGGYETLIVLSQSYRKDKRYNRRLLISTFIHELIHSYLFIRCGFKAKRFGGHTVGFRRIASLIDEWAGPDTLFLSNMEADLDDFLQSHSHEDIFRNCGMQCSEDINPQQASYLSPGLRLLDQRSYSDGFDPM